MTVSAARSARAIGADRAEITAVVRSAESAHFYKPMTSYGDHRQWRDVYHVPWQGLTIYLKFTADVVTDFLPLSFKER